MLEVIIGNDDFLVNRTIEKSIKAYTDFNPDSEVVHFDMLDRGFTFDFVFQSLTTISLFSNSKMLVLVTRDKQLKKEDDAILLKLMESTADNHLLIIFEKKPLAKSKVKPFMEKHAKIHTVKAMDDAQRIQFVTQEVKHRKLNMKRDAILALESHVSDNIMRLGSELDKLELLEKEITVKDVKETVPRSLSKNVFALSNALLSKQTTETFDIYQDLMSLRVEHLELIGLLASNLRIIYQVSALLEKGLSIDDIASRLNTSVGHVRVVMRNRVMSKQSVLSLMNELAKIDQDIKMGRQDRFVAMEMFMLNVLNA